MKFTITRGLLALATVSLLVTACGPDDTAGTSAGGASSRTDSSSSPASAAAEKVANTDPCGIGLHPSSYYKSDKCYPVAIAPVGADAAPAVVGIVDTPGWPALTVTTGGGLAYDTRIGFNDAGVTRLSAAEMAAGTKIYDLDGRPGAEIVVPVAKRSPSLAYYEVFSVRNGELQNVSAPAPISAPLTLGTDVWYFVGELNISRVICRDSGISVGQLPAPYTEPVELVDFVSKPSTSKGEAGEWIVAGKRTAEPSALGSTDSASRQSHFMCDDLRTKSLVTSTPVTTAVPGSSTPAAITTTAACGSTNADTTVAAAITGLPKIHGWPWHTPADTSGFDPCKTLSFATTTVEGATNSSPEAVLLFHKGEFVGTASECSPPISDVKSSGDDSVVVTYRYPNEGDPNADMTGRATRTYRWDDGKVVKSGEVPARLTQLAGCNP